MLRVIEKHDADWTRSNGLGLSEPALRCRMMSLVQARLLLTVCEQRNHREG